MDSNHKCKLCSRIFTNGRALGGHMKAHLTSPPPPTAPPPLPPPSIMVPSSSDEDSKRFSDPVFDIVLQDRVSDTESRNPTPKRSKRHRKPPPEPTRSISDTSPEESLAMCLIMLSRDRRIQNDQIPNEKKEIRRKMKKCEKCRKQFRSYRAMFSHEKVCELKTELDEEEEEGSCRMMFKCPFCFKIFGSGQALGGHKRTHVVSSTNAAVNSSVSFKLEISLIDLNLPPQLEDHHYTLVSDAS